MRLKRLDLKAFGSFTDRTLDFATRGGPGLHIVFGANEAGKSTSLRALKALLYGFPERTSDNFQHKSSNLLVGGCLEGADGQELSFFRRKRRKADLLDLDGNPMDPGTLAAFLHGVELGLFASLYGIDHRTLVAGGEDILAQKGEVGQALFAAGSGISSLRKILDSLDLESGELFKPRGTNQPINKAINEYKELKKMVRVASLPSRKWQEHKKCLQKAEDEQVKLEEEMREKSSEVQRLVRLSKAIPEVAELENLQNQLLELGDVVLLPLEFSEQFRQLEQDRREITLQIDKDGDRLQKLRITQDSITLNKVLLGHGAMIEDLYQRLGEYRKGQKDRNRLDGMRITHKKDAGSLLVTIRPGLKLTEVDALRPVLAKKRTIQELSSRRESLHQKLSQVRQQKDTAEKEVKEISRILAAQVNIPEVDALNSALTLARRVGDIDGQITMISREIAQGQKNCHSALKRLGLWSGDLEQLQELALPMLETVRRFAGDLGELEKETAHLVKEREKVVTHLETAKTNSKEISYGGEVPSEQDLRESRQKRQDGWHLLCRQWFDGEDIAKEAEEYEADQAVHKAYERHVERADHLADRLRREAGRVAKLAALRAEIESLEGTIKTLSLQDKELAKRREDLVTSWQRVWEVIAIKPLFPKEMLDWLTDINILRLKVTETLNRETEVIDRKRLREQHRKILRQELKNLGEEGKFSRSDRDQELAPILIFTEAVLADISKRQILLEKNYDKQLRIKTTLAKAEKEAITAELAVQKWHGHWERALAGLGLASQILPSEALDLLETIGSCLDKLEKAKEFLSRINGIDRDINKFTDDVQTLLREIAPDLVELSPDQAVLQLYSRMGKVRQESELLKKRGQEAESLSLEIEGAKKALQSMDGQMAEFLTIAKCHEAVDIVGVIAKSLEYQRLHENISAARSSLAKVSDGISQEEIKLQAAGINVDELPGQIVSLKHYIDSELQPRYRDILKLTGEEEKELQLMDGGAAAAEGAEKMARVATKIRRLVELYTKLKLAAKVLKDEIECYRKENQDPVLLIAARYFTALTLGAFSNLRTDVDDRGNPILVGVRSDDSRLTVAGMSSGTCDQLYLALRLATLEWRLESSEPMPFIVDDILINFDDARSMATLTALAGLAKKNQVILFTHHRQIVDAVKTITCTGEVYVHEL